MTSAVRIVNKSGHPFKRSTDGAIGFDLRATIGSSRTIWPGERCKFGTGISIELPLGWGAFVMPRSGLSINHGIVALIGVIDRDYRGEIQVVLMNMSDEFYRVNPGDRIAQLVPVLIPNAGLSMECVEGDRELSNTDRGDRGFGSTGR